MLEDNAVYPPPPVTKNTTTFDKIDIGESFLLFEKIVETCIHSHHYQYQEYKKTKPIIIPAGTIDMNDFVLGGYSESKELNARADTFNVYISPDTQVERLRKRKKKWS